MNIVKRLVARPAAPRTVAYRRARGILAGLATAAALIIVLTLAGCGPSRASTGPAAKASARATASQVVNGIRTGQAAQQAEGIVRACAVKYSGIPLVRCIAPKAPAGAHRRAFDHCALAAMAQDIPGREVKFVQADLPGCLVANR
jgi:hypothetical protein